MAEEVEKLRGVKENAREGYSEKDGGEEEKQ